MAAPERALNPGRELTPTGRVILGMLMLGKRTGYEIKQLVDKSTRHFWAASYGQIYPELRRLEEQGLIASRPEPSGGRARTVLDLTDAGRAALDDWLQSDADQLYELRDEGMLKLFFSDAATPERRLEIVRRMRTRYESKVAQLRAMEASAQTKQHKGPYLALRLGIRHSECLIDWCKATEAELAADIEEA